jgi:hypothetical protein
MSKVGMAEGYTTRSNEHRFTKPVDRKNPLHTVFSPTPCRRQMVRVTGVLHNAAKDPTRQARLN